MSSPLVEFPRPGSVDSCRSSNSTTSQTKFRNKQQKICVGEEVKISVDVAMQRFRLNEEQKELEFPSSMTSSERAYVHKLVQALGYKSKSRGHGYNRFLTVYKKTTKASQTFHSFTLIQQSQNQIQTLLQMCPVTQREKQELQPRTDRTYSNEQVMKELSRTVIGRIHNAVPQVPPAVTNPNPDLMAFKQSLPATAQRESIISTINANKVCIIAGETGSGKTTQIPQMILEDCHEQNKPCRIFCTQPRRIAALTVADRVASERGEPVGQTVGYQIRLENKLSMNTLLVFCTNGVLLRSLMSKDDTMATVTHVIVDEIHERDRFSDFLLIVLRDLLEKQSNGNLRVILMSATANTELFVDYFNGCPLVEIPGKLFDVQEHFLADVLKMTGHMTDAMKKIKKEIMNVSTQQVKLDNWTSTKPESKTAGDLNSDEQKPMSTVSNASTVSTTTGTENSEEEIPEDKDDLEPWLVEELDRLLALAWLQGEHETFVDILALINKHQISVDYAHSETTVTALMVASGRGNLSVVEQLLQMGANISIRASNEWRALEWAREMGQPIIVELLEAQHAVTEQTACQEESVLVCHADSLTEADKELLNIYHRSFNDDMIDVKLIQTLVHKIHTGEKPGAILIFLPGYDDIMSVKEAILEDKRLSDNSYSLYLLHSAMQTNDQRRVFKPAPNGTRKIILSTQIAETSVTIDDVVYVIDSGKLKEKSFDALTSVSSLKVEWVSKASAAQRKGRAGRTRTGICYHLFSRVRYDNMIPYQIPELLRHPLPELCLNTKLLTVNGPIADFLAKAPEPPAFLVTRNSVHLLKQMDALDAFEDLTEIGHHLADLPIEPRYGKMLLYSIVLKCLDPVLTIVCTLSHRDPFLLPAQPYQKRQATNARRKFAAGTFSDHMALLRAFQCWQKACSEQWDRSFCKKNFLSAATMDMIIGLRTQLLGHLRASGFVRPRGAGDIRDLNSNSENWCVVKGALLAGLYPNIMKVDRKKKVLVSFKESNARFHNSSTLCPAVTPPGPSTHSECLDVLPSDWLIYEELTGGQRLARVRCCTVVTPISVALFAGPGKLPQDNVMTAENPMHGEYTKQQQQNVDGGDGFEDNSDDDEPIMKNNYVLDDFIAFNVDPQVANMTMQLRQKWHSLFLRRMRGPTKPWTQADDSIIRTIVNVLSTEEQALRLPQPVGIGRRPRPMPDWRGTSQDSSENSSENGSRLQKSNSQYRSFEDPSDTSSTQSCGSGAASHSSSNNSLRNSPCSSPSNPESPSPTMGASLDPSHVYSSTHPSRFFVMKSTSQKNIEISSQQGIWATSLGNERKITKAFKDGKSVYLIFSIQGSGSFQGYAKMTSLPLDKPSDLQGPNLGNVFHVEWIYKLNVAFQQTHHLVNAWNENKRVQESRDGQELEPAVGESLLRLWDTFSPGRSRTADESMTAYEALDFPYYAQGAPQGQRQNRYWSSSRGRPIHGGGGPGAYNMTGFQQHLPQYGAPMMAPHGAMVPPSRYQTPQRFLQGQNQMPRGQGHMYYGNQKHYK